MRSKFTKAFTLVEMLVALAVSSIIVAAAYSSFEMVSSQYKKNMDVIDMHTSGRAVMRIIERDVRMAGFEYRDTDAKKIYGTISNPLAIIDSGNKCCDEVTVIYDYYDEDTQKAERLKIRYWAEAYSTNKGARHRLYKQKDILGQNKKILAKPILGKKDVMADYIEDLQIGDAELDRMGAPNYVKIGKNGSDLPNSAAQWVCVKDKKNGLIWEVKVKSTGLHYQKDYYSWYDSNPSTNGGNSGRKSNWFKPGQKLQNSEDFILAINNKKMCGYSKWRLPIVDELRTIVDKTKRPSIDTNFFPYTATGASYWTSSEDPSYLKRHGIGAHRKGEWVWAINFSNGSEHDGYHKSNVEFIRAVNKIGAGAMVKLININFSLRTKNQYGQNRQFKKKDYHGGNFKLDKTDKYKRDTFSSTVLVRNLAL
jgi:prepilin-type N-terminal cleavage/methylation domain-containing protein